MPRDPTPQASWTLGWPALAYSAVRLFLWPRQRLASLNKRELPRRELPSSERGGACARFVTLSRKFPIDRHGGSVSLADTSDAPPQEAGAAVNSLLNPR